MIKELIDNEKSGAKTECISRFLRLLKEYNDVTCEDSELLSLLKKKDIIHFSIGYFIHEFKGDTNIVDIYMLGLPLIIWRK